MYRILIVEDDNSIATSLKEHLTSWNYQVKVVQNLQNIIPEFVEFDPHLLLLDIGLPYFNGYHWCAKIRQLSKVPIIFISSASDNMNIIMAISQGGDDFIPKPFDINVLLAKIQSLLRRTYDFAGKVNLLEHNGVILNQHDNTIQYQNNQIELTKNEYRILQLLLENKTQIVSRDDLMMRLWETDSFVDDNTLTVNMTRLRKKLEGLGLNEFIITKKGIGYMVK